MIYQVNHITEYAYLVHIIFVVGANHVAQCILDSFNLRRGLESHQLRKWFGNLTLVLVVLAELVIALQVSALSGWLHLGRLIRRLLIARFLLLLLLFSLCFLRLWLCTVVLLSLISSRWPSSLSGVRLWCVSLWFLGAHWIRKDDLMIVLTLQYLISPLW